jgi:hypothetical protein
VDPVSGPQLLRKSGSAGGVFHIWRKYSQVFRAEVVFRRYSDLKYMPKIEQYVSSDKINS